MGLKPTLFLIGFALLGTACSLKHCRGPGDKPLPQKNTGKKALKTENSIWVYKYDGGKQCDRRPPVGIKTAQKDLGEIPVLEAKKQNDGLMRIQACGAPTGMANTYKINKADLSDAEARGFKPWTFSK